MSKSKGIAGIVPYVVVAGVVYSIFGKKKVELSVAGVNAASCDDLFVMAEGQLPGQQIAAIKVLYDSSSSFAPSMLESLADGMEKLGTVPDPIGFQAKFVRCLRDRAKLIRSKAMTKTNPWGGPGTTKDAIPPGLETAAKAVWSLLGIPWPGDLPPALPSGGDPKALPPLSGLLGDG